RDKITGPFQGLLAGELEQALARPDIAAAWPLYISLLASGAIGLSGQRDWAVKLASIAVDDDALAPEQFAAIAALLGPQIADRDAALCQRMEARLAARRWHDRVEKTAAEWAWGKKI